MAGDRTSVVRLTATEYEPRIKFVQDAAQATGIHESAVRDLVGQAGVRVAKLVGFQQPPIWVTDDTLQANGVAGLVRLSPRLELEIAPKFLGSDWQTWREDFFVVANVARGGQVLIRERLASSTGQRDDLASLVGRTMVDLFETQRRKPLRTYRQHTTNEWGLDGDIEPESLFLPSADGFELRRLRLTRENAFNATMAAAATALAPDVRDGLVQQQLRRMRHRLGPQAPPPRSLARRVPSRHQQWQPLYDLSKEVLAGFGVRLEPGYLRAPGYIIDTSRAFEELIVAALRIGARPAQVEHHPTYNLGQRTSGDDVDVTPDVLVRHLNNAEWLVDAKYKGRVDKTTKISSADLYESLAFMDASGKDELALVYPSPTGPGSAPQPIPGASYVLDGVEVSGRRVVAIAVECRGLSQRGGYLRFAEGLATGIRDTLTM